MKKYLDIKLEKIHQGKYKPSDFIIADAKDADMGGGIKAPGPVHEEPSRTKSFTDSCRPCARLAGVDLLMWC